MSSLPNNLQNLTKIRTNQRFATYRAVDINSGETVFVKQVLHAELSDSLREEMYGLERMKQLARLHAFPFQVPKVLDNGKDYIVTTWAEGTVMPFEADLHDIDARISFLARGYAAIDHATELANPLPTKFSVPGGKHNRTTIQHIEHTLAEVDYSQYFDKTLIRRGFEYLNAGAPKLVARFTHADFTPHNILEDDNVRTLIDWESASELWPRFYDVVNFTHNTALQQPQLTSELQKLIVVFFDEIKSDYTEHLEQLNTIALTRAISSIGELMTKPNAYHNTTDSMTPESAAILTATIERILNGKLYI